MTKYWIILFFMFADTSLQAQPSLPDSIRSTLHNSPIDSNYVKNLITAILYLPYSQPDSAYYYADYALKLSQQLEFKYGIAYSYLVMAECFIYKGDYSKAIYYVYQHLSLFNSLGDLDGINLAYYQLAEIYTELGDFKKALEYKLKVRKNLISVGFKEINKWHNPNRKMEIWFHDYNLGLAYLNMQMIDSALKYSETAFLGNKDWSIIPVLMGNIFLLKQDYPNALKYYNTLTTENYPVDSVKNFVGKALAFKQIQEPDSSLIFAMKALDIARRINYAKGILQASEILSDHFESRDLNEALKYLKIANAGKDSLYNKGRINQVNSITFNEELRRLDVIAAQQAARNQFRIWSLLVVLVEEYYRLAYHSYMSTKKLSNEIKLITDLDSSLPLVNVITQDIGQVLLNLYNNAFWFLSEALAKDRFLSEALAKDRFLSEALAKDRFLSEALAKDRFSSVALDARNLPGLTGDTNRTLAGLNPNYTPTIILTTKNLGDKIEISIHDNGTGIPPNIIDKIFQPFFTTKPTGQGTGLGLSLAYDLVTKGHNGSLKVFSEEGQGSEFIIQLPV